MTLGQGREQLEGRERGERVRERERERGGGERERKRERGRRWEQMEEWRKRGGFIIISNCPFIIIIFSMYCNLGNIHFHTYMYILYIKLL